MNPIGLQVILYTLGFALHVDEYHDPNIADFADKANEQRHFVCIGWKVDGLPNPVYRHLVGLDANELGFIHVFVGKLQNALGQSCREQHIQSFFRARQAPQ